MALLTIKAALPAFMHAVFKLLGLIYLPLTEQIEINGKNRAEIVLITANLRWF